MKIAFLGIGLMGGPMVSRLIDAGFALALWNRTESKLTPFAQRATLAATPEVAVSNADVVVTMLENGQVVDQVLYTSGALAALKPGAVVIDMSSISPALAQQHHAQVVAAGGDYLDAPVSGGTRGAAAGSLSIMAGGEAQVLKRVAPLFGHLGTVTHIGPVGTGQVAKLANQAVVGITIAAVSEALLLARQSGADPAAVRQALLGGFAGSAIMQQHGERMLLRDFSPGAPARIQLKDMTMITEAARLQGLTLPLSEQVLEQYHSLVASGDGELDHSALYLELERRNAMTHGDSA